MAEIIHRKGNRYRIWYSIPDQYAGDAVTRKRMKAHLIASGGHQRDVEDRLARADATGTSAPGRTRDATKWDTERCNYCSCFHHTYDPRPDGSCRSCGGQMNDVGHQPPCNPKGGAR